MQKHLRSTIQKAVKDALSEYILSAARIVSVSLVFILLFISLFLSQNIAPLYFGVINEDRAAFVTTLRRIEKTREYPYLLGLATRIFGEQIKDGVNLEKTKRKQRIQKLENVLRQNGSARDILLTLSFLYKDDGNLLKSDEYLKQAKSLDPLLK